MMENGQMTENEAGTCIFHDQYEQKLLDVHDWSQGAKIKISAMCKKIDGNKVEQQAAIKEVKASMEKKVDELKADFNNGIKRLIYLVIGSVILQIIASAILGGHLK